MNEIFFLIKVVRCFFNASYIAMTMQTQIELRTAPPRHNINIPSYTM